MGDPFYAEYLSRYEKKVAETTGYDDVVNQFMVVAQHTFDPVTGLYRHAWDESREMFWADSVTGQSAHAWGRALGWYVMGIVDVLDYLPEKYEGREKLIGLLQEIYRVLPKYADPVTGMWYQVLDSPEREGNYLESTCSAMFVYAMLKGVRCGYLDAGLREKAFDLYRRFIDTFIRTAPDGTVSLTDCCEVAGLGGKTNRSGTFEYYIGEPVRDNDPKGVGPFIWASLEYEAMNGIEYDPYADVLRPIAFPGAEGGGMYVTGGRGGRVIYVTKLADDGTEGTLRHAIEQTGPRTILFAVSGTIVLNEPLEIKHGDLTIAGQSAPGEGICVSEHPVSVETDNVIVRYMRFRMGDRAAEEADSFSGVGCSDVIIDHCSISWSTDECASFYANKNYTMQWCLISESLNSSVHHKGNHGYGAIWGGRNATFHHNLLADNNSRNARLDHPSVYTNRLLLMNRGPVEFVNNVIYNWGNYATYGGEEGQWNVVNNYYKPGPDSKNGHKQFMEISVSKTTSLIPGHYYVSGNVLEGADAVTDDNWKGIRIKGDRTREWIEVSEPYVVRGTLRIDPANEAFEKVLDGCGASLYRDEVDRRVIEEARRGIYHFIGSKSGLRGIIDSQEEVGGWPDLRSGKAPVDTDGDGMPDKWERRHGLDPHDASDGSAFTLDQGFTNLEIYLNSLVE